MTEKFLSITGGICGAFLWADFWQIALQVGGSILLAFIGGAVGLAGRDFYKWIKEKYNNRRAKRAAK